MKTICTFRTETSILADSARSRRQPHEPPHWAIYLQADDCDATTAQAKKLALTFREPMTIEHVGVSACRRSAGRRVFTLYSISTSAFITTQ